MLAHLTGILLRVEGDRQRKSFKKQLVPAYLRRILVRATALAVAHSRPYLFSCVLPPSRIVDFCRLSAEAIFERIPVRFSEMPSSRESTKIPITFKRGNGKLRTRVLPTLVAASQQGFWRGRDFRHLGRQNFYKPPDTVTAASTSYFL